MFWWFKVEGHEKAWPIYSVETKYILANKVGIAWPECFKLIHIIEKSYAGNVIRQGVKPDINNMVFVHWNRYAPVKACPAHT